MKVKENGMSLIALVVTIIVLILLAGVTISNIRNDSGLFNKSLEARDEKIASEENEAIQWAAAQAVADDSNKTGQIIDKGQIAEKLDKYIGNQNEDMEYQIFGPEEEYKGTMIISDTYVVEFSKSGNSYIIDGSGNVRRDETGDKVASRDGVLIKPASTSINIGSELTLNILANTNDYKVTCSDESVLDVKKDKNGKILVENNKIFVRGKELGKATILVETSKEKRAMSYVTVHQEPTSIELTASGHILDISSAIKSLQIKPTIYPSTANYKTGIKWTSSNNDIAVVDENGFVTGISNGDVTITATTENGKTATWNVTVISTPLSIGLDKENVTLDISTNKTYQFKATIYPSTANTDIGLTWSSSDNSVATVNKDGVVTGVKNGTTVITVVTENKKVTSASVTVQTSPVSISISPSSATIDLSAENKSVQLKATISPNTTNIKDKITWTSTNNNIATVDSNGLVRGYANGTVTITATTANGKSTKATITVQTSPTSITLSTNKIVLEKYTNKNYQLKAIVRPTNANVYTNVSWTSSNNGIVTVNGNGYVTAIGTGTATITATTGNGLSAKCTVVVENKVQRITASPNSAAIKVGDTFTSKITCSPSDTTEQIVCVNSNSKVISTNMIASGNGTYNLTVNGIAIGNATITIKNSSSTVYAQISVNVGLHISRGWSDAGAVSSGWKQLGDVINNTACSTIKSIKGSANIGANSMWSDRYFGLRIMALDTSGNWVEIWSRYSGTFTWNFGKDRYYSADISLTPNKVYYSFALQFMYSTNVDSGGAKYSNFSIDIGT